MQTVNVAFGAALAMLLATGCSLDGLLNSDELPKSVSDPALTETPGGARAAYVGAAAQFRDVFGARSSLRYSLVQTAGLLSDELGSTDFGVAPMQLVDQRVLPEANGDPSSVYSGLQKMRGEAGQAIGLLTRYLPDEPALAGRLYALQGYAEIFLAELYCSGVPLSTLDYGGDFTYRPGSTTSQVFIHAVALFDTALALSADSVNLLQLARVGQGRALLGVGEYAAAAVAVTAVPDAYHYDITYSATGRNPNGSTNLSGGNFAYTGTEVGRWSMTVANREGVNGLDYRTSNDPRTRVTQLGTSPGGVAVYHPDKYDTVGTTPIVLASGVEARLIEAEAALQAGDIPTWLAKLNHLRETAITPALADLADPGTPDTRVDLLFRERAFWLFLTGHRQGDLRRLIRQYGRSDSDVYPIGPYPVGVSAYGADFTMPITAKEFANPLYTGCISRGA